MTNFHPTTKLYYRDSPVWIDAQIAPLLQALWDKDYTTEYSCQGTREGDEWPDHSQKPYIIFTYPSDALMFLEETARKMARDCPPDPTKEQKVQIYYEGPEMMAYDQITMRIICPVNWQKQHSDGRMRATVEWPIELTDTLVQAWSDQG